MRAGEARTYAWRRCDENAGHSFARLDDGPDGWLAHGVEVLATETGALSCAFRVELDGQWRTRSVRVSAVDGDGERTLHLYADGHGRWWRGDVAADDLRGCVDVDVAATPLTNTFPIRRLDQLAVGERSTSAVAWVEVPSLRVVRVEQTYRRLAPARWEYSDSTHGAFVLDVDADGVVTDYEGFATRVT